MIRVKKLSASALQKMNGRSSMLSPGYPADRIHSFFLNQDQNDRRIWTITIFSQIALESRENKIFRLFVEIS